MNEPKKQHYVPKIYLEKFSFSSSSPYKIFVLHKDKNKIFPVNVSDTASERHFYTVNKNNDKYLWEKTYATAIEPLMSEVQSKIISKCDNVLIQNNSLVLTPEIKLKLSFTMVCQLLRGKQCRKYSCKTYFDNLPSAIEKAYQKFNLIDEKKQIVINNFINNDDYFKEVLMHGTFNINMIEKLTKILYQRNFLILKTTGKMEFITSDNPVMFVNSLSLNSTPFSNGLEKNTTVIFFPLSPKLLIAAFHPNSYFGALTEDDGRLLFLNKDNDLSFIKTHNQRQWEQSFNQIYSKSNSLLEKLF